VGPCRFSGGAAMSVAGFIMLELDWREGLM
jgi:hypothetical protein